MKGTRVYTKHKCNTDALCYEDGPKQLSIIKKIKLWQYRYNLWTGMYILDAPERFVVNVILGSVLGTLGYASISFWVGFVSGVMSGE